MRPHCRVVGGAKIVEFGEEPIAQLGRRLGCESLFDRLRITGSPYRDIVTTIEPPVAGSAWLLGARRLVRWRREVGSTRIDRDRTAYLSIILQMIRSFRCKDTQRIWQGQSSRKFPGDIQDRALRKLRQLDAAAILEDLRNPPGNQLEVLRGKRTGQMSIRINDQWRICFRWVDHDAWDVEIVDYH